VPAADAVVAAHYAEQQRLARAVLATVLPRWPSTVDNLPLRYGGLLPLLLASLTAGQLLAATSADDYTATLLGAGDRPPAAPVDPVLLAGTASDGRELVSLLLSPLIDMQTAVRAGLAAADALERGRESFTQIVATQVADAGRVAVGMATVSHGAAGYIRVLVPPSCARCAVLAGKFFRWNRGFQRHPRCDCRHRPVGSAEADMAPDPKTYFDSLSREQQDKVFTAAGAQAIRDGADISQVVNARRGISTASVGGRDILHTTEGVTRRGWYAAVQQALDPLVRFDKTPASRVQRSRRPRLMPEQIYSLGLGREETQRLLTRNGYFLDASTDVEGRHALERIARQLLAQ
jgi:hypothetical protein